MGDLRVETPGVRRSRLSDASRRMLNAAEAAHNASAYMHTSVWHGMDPEDESESADLKATAALAKRMEALFDDIAAYNEYRIGNRPLPVPDEEQPGTARHG